MRFRPYSGDVSTIVEGDFEWDSSKAATNEQKHGVTFAEAATVFADPNGKDFPDPTKPDNMRTIGFSLQARVLYVVTTERGPRTRIISARPATSSERLRYAEG